MSCLAHCRCHICLALLQNVLHVSNVSKKGLNQTHEVRPGTVATRSQLGEKVSS